MLQFIIGLATVNVSWLFAGLLGGFRFYNSPPLFFIALAGFLGTRFYSVALLRGIVVIGAIGVASGVVSGFDSWHVRQTVAFVVAAAGWLYVYQRAMQKDIFTTQRTNWILVAYVTYLIVVLIENAVGVHAISYAVSCVFSPQCGASAVYAAAGRMPYFSAEASTAALAIVATIMPFVCAQVAVKRSPYSILLLGLACVILFFAEGLTSRMLMVYSIAFVLLPRFAVISIPALMGTIIVTAGAVSYVLDEQGALLDLVQTWFGGYSPRVDAGIDSGSYVARSMNWLIGARAFLSSPIWGIGIGGTQSFFYQLYDAGFDVAPAGEQEMIVNEEVSAYNSPMVVRIPAELGIIGVVYLGYYGYRAMRLALQRQPDPLLGHAFLYSFGALLLSFCFAGELLNPCIPAFIALLAQVLRARRAAAAVEPATVPQESALATSADVPSHAG